MKKLIILFSFLFSSTILFAQDAPCTVSVDALKGTYTGGCKNGKADGEGVAKGIDSYEGTFKNGLPEGIGMYIWKNGDLFYGSWKKGLKEGKGELHVPINDKDSTINGYWKNDVYKGRYEKLFIVHNSSSDVGRVEVNNITGGKLNSITLNVESLVGGGSVFSSSNLSQLTQMTGMEISGGSYMSKSSTTLTNKDVTIFQGVVFPFRARFNFGASMIDIEIFGEGDWHINVPINNK